MSIHITYLAPCVRAAWVYYLRGGARCNFCGIAYPQKGAFSSIIARGQPMAGGVCFSIAGKR
eukprot:1979228-Lingulodinium_polyedra.AAC.1